MIFWKSIAFSASLLYLLALAKKPCFGCQPMERQGLRRAEPLHKLWTWSKSLYNYVRVEYVNVTLCNNQCMYRSNSYSATVCTHPVHTPSIYTLLCFVHTWHGMWGLGFRALRINASRKESSSACAKSHGSNEKRKKQRTSAMWHLDRFWNILIHLGTCCSDELNGI